MKHNLIVLFVLTLITAIFFSGCTGLKVGGSTYSGETKSPDITTGIIARPSTGGGTKLEPLPKPGEGGLFNNEAAFSYIAGLKIGYDSSIQFADYASDLSTAPYTEQLFEDLIDSLSAGYENFDAESFLSFHPNMDLDSTKIYRLIWMYSLIEQYDLLSKLIISDFVGNYGFGYSQNTELESILYPLVNLGVSVVPTVENLGSIDFIATQTVQGLVVSNPNYIPSTDPNYSASTYAYKDYQDFTLDLENSKFIIDTNEYNVVVPTSIISEFTGWVINGLNLSKAYLEYINSFSFVNPVYDSTNQDPSDITSHQSLYINATISNGTVSYQLSLNAPTQVAINSANYLNSFISQNSLYLAYKIFEAVCNVPVSSQFSGAPDEISILNFLSIMPTYLSMGGRIGLVEKDFEVEVGDLTFPEKILDVLENKFIGFVDAQLSTSLEAFITARINQYVVDSSNCVVCADSTDNDAKKLFVDSYNIEYIDISSSKLLGSKDDFIADYGNIVNVVFMVNELENPTYFDSICLVFSAQNYGVDLSTYFRFVQDGTEKLFENFDYAVARESDDEFSSDFDGNIPKLEGDELTMEYAEATLLNVTKENAPNSNIFYNHEMIVDEFKNNNSSEFLRAVNIKNSSTYGYDSNKNCYYYGETASDCDYVELSFIATNSENNISYSFTYLFWYMEEKTA